MRADYQVILVNDEIANRARRHIQTKSLPVVSIVEGNIYGALASAEEQAPPHRVFADGIDGSVIRQPIHDLLPCCAAVMSSVDVRMLIVQANAIDRRIGGLRIEAACVDKRNLAP